MRTSCLYRLTLAFFLGSYIKTGFAHAILVKSNPPPDAVVRETPNPIELWFNEPVGEQYAALAVIDQDGRRVDSKDARRGTVDPSLLSVSVPKIPDGAYTVRYRVLSADGHVVSGKYVFTVDATK